MPRKYMYIIYIIASIIELRITYLYIFAWFQKYRLHIKKLPAAGSSAGNTSTDACEVDDVAPEVDKSVNHA